MTQSPGSEPSARRYGEARPLAPMGGIGTPDGPRTFRPRCAVSRPWKRVGNGPRSGRTAHVSRTWATKRVGCLALTAYGGEP